MQLPNHSRLQRSLWLALLGGALLTTAGCKDRTPDTSGANVVSPDRPIEAARTMAPEATARHLPPGGEAPTSLLAKLEEAKVERARVELNLVAQSISLYRVLNMKLPARLEVLVRPEEGAPILKESHLKDPWGRPLQYSVAGGKYTLSSAGPDGQAGTDDDVIHPPE